MPPTPAQKLLPPRTHHFVHSALHNPLHTCTAPQTHQELELPSPLLLPFPSNPPFPGGWKRPRMTSQHVMPLSLAMVTPFNRCCAAMKSCGSGMEASPPAIFFSSSLGGWVRRSVSVAKVWRRRGGGGGEIQSTFPQFLRIGVGGGGGGVGWPKLIQNCRPKKYSIPHIIFSPP